MTLTPLGKLVVAVVLGVLATLLLIRLQADYSACMARWNDQGVCGIG